jgi:hypothetical protein
MTVKARDAVPMTTSTDFDFLTGHWNVANRRLGKLLVGSDDWDEFPGVAAAHTVFGGTGNFDEIAFPTKGFSGMTLRLFAPETGLWSLYWANNRDGLLQPPVLGSFTDGVGTFFGDDEHEGAPIRVRYLWSGISTDHPRWEQAFSVDGDQTWETNWIMDLTRIG